jgi:serine-type D-Ala-D-Ala carboxypeptidase/endopeptidase
MEADRRSPAQSIHEMSQLYIQALGQPRFEAFAEHATEFSLKVEDVRIVSNMGRDGRAQSLVLCQGGQAMPGLRVW